MAGITVAIMLVPQGLAYAILAGLPPIYGLYTGFVPLFIYAVLGTSRHICPGPEALTALLIGDVLSGIQVPDHLDAEAAANYIPDAAHLLALLCGIFTLILGLFRLGFIDNLISRSLLAGFINAAAVIIAFQQIPGILELTCNECSQVEYQFLMIPKVIQALGSTHWIAVYVGGGSVVFLFFVKILKIVFRKYALMKLIPEILIVVVATTFLTWKFELYNEITVLGANPKNLEGSFPVPSWSASPIRFISVGDGLPLLKKLFPSAIIISIVGFVEAMVVGKKYAGEFDYQVSPNRELVAFGFGNTIGSFFQIFPSYSSMPRTVINVAAGARTQLSTLVSAILIGFSFYCLPWFKYLPSCVMSGIIFVAAIGLVETHDILFIVRTRAWVEFSLFVTTFLLTAVLSIEIGLGVSFMISVLRVVSKTSKPRMVMLGKAKALFWRETTPGNDDKRGDSAAPFTSVTSDDCKVKYRNILDEGTRPLRGVLLCQIREPLHFANIKFIQDRLIRIETLGHIQAHPGEELRVKHPLYGVILDMGNVASIDNSALQTLLEMNDFYLNKGVPLCFTKLTSRAKMQGTNCHFVETVGLERFFQTNHEAVAYARGLTIHNGEQLSIHYPRSRVSSAGSAGHPPQTTQARQGNSASALERFPDYGSTTAVDGDWVDQKYEGTEQSVFRSYHGFQIAGDDDGGPVVGPECEGGGDRLLGDRLLDDAV
eukprot:TRINITY_DN228_c0_g1_i4.p1 TRINITY_DN228_c0_g1~~TRINITY_DN228_c0_g1_i4.p1  ORF type:complete len:713 (+),score=97.48 TRINITY_DN228_c0_g1_i4:462-2600(+)